MSELQERCDCKENYTNVEQDEIQSAYFGNTCFRIFTACSYYNGHGKLSKNPITIITEKSLNNCSFHLFQQSCTQHPTLNASAFQEGLCLEP